MQFVGVQIIDIILLIYYPLKYLLGNENNLLKEVLTACRKLNISMSLYVRQHRAMPTQACNMVMHMLM